MTRTLGVVMDALETINYKKDSTLAMLWEAHDRDFLIYYMRQKDLALWNNVPYAQAKLLRVSRDQHNFYEIVDEQKIALSELDVILMRKDPPFNEEYIYATYLLEHAEKQGVLVVNRPQSLRDANEKLFTTYFPQCCPPSVVTQSIIVLRDFLQTYTDIVCKPLNTMGGLSIFRLRENDVNANVVFEMLTKYESTSIMAQQYIPAITAGDKRILLINGVPFPQALARIPQGHDWRGNLAVGAKGVVQPLSKRDYFICEQLQPALQSRGLYFVGIDIIGDYLTEINVTSPTGIRELDNHLHANISALLFECIEPQLT